jgi:hypothetical protein
MRNKLMVDGGVIGGQREQFAYIYSRLEKTLQNMTVAFVERGSPDGHYNPDRFFNHLDTCYGNPNAQYKAIDRLRNIKQRDNENFAAFLPRFEKELADSSGSEWSDTICINYLEGALND